MDGAQINERDRWGGPFVSKDDRCGHFYNNILIHIRTDMACESCKADWWIERGDMEDVEYFINRLRKRYSTWAVWYDEAKTTIEMRKEE